MPCLTTTNQQLRQKGPLLEVYIAPSSVMRRQLEAEGGQIPMPIKKTFLVDTGASSTVMKAGIAAELGLVPKGQTAVPTP